MKPLCGLDLMSNRHAVSLIFFLPELHQSHLSYNVCLYANLLLAWMTTVSSGFSNRSAKEAEDNIRKALEKGQVLPKEERFDSNCITPGMFNEIEWINIHLHVGTWCC